MTTQRFALDAMRRRLDDLAARIGDLDLEEHRLRDIVAKHEVARERLKAAMREGPTVNEDRLRSLSRMIERVAAGIGDNRPPVVH